MTTLHERIRAELDRRTAVANAASHGGTGEWSRPDPDHSYGRIEDENGHLVVYDEGSPTESEAEHIALHDPADALRRYAGELEVLERHAPGPDDTGWYCRWCYAGISQETGADEFLPYPCDEVRSLASRLGIMVEEWRP